MRRVAPRAPAEIDDAARGASECDEAQSGGVEAVRAATIPCQSEQCAPIQGMAQRGRGSGGERTGGGGGGDWGGGGGGEEGSGGSAMEGRMQCMRHASQSYTERPQCHGAKSCAAQSFATWSAAAIT